MHMVYSCIVVSKSIMSPVFLISCDLSEDLYHSDHVLHGHNLPTLKNDNFIFYVLSFLMVCSASPHMTQHFHFNKLLDGFYNCGCEFSYLIACSFFSIMFKRI